MARRVSGDAFGGHGVSDLDDSFAVLLGRLPTDKEKQNLYRARDALKIKATDAVWLLLMALQHYETLYEQVPGRIATAARDVTANVRQTAEAEARAAQAETQKALMRAVHEAAVTSAKQAAGAQLAKWVSIGIGVIAVTLALLSWGAFRRGRETGLAVGEDQGRQACDALAAASSWANTPEGQLAYELAKVGGLGEVARCSGRGMGARDGWCNVPSDRGKVWARWPIPPLSRRTGEGAP
jgi:hypothetical protein